MDTEYPLEIGVDEARRLLEEAKASTRLIDVREADEVAICSIPGSEHIPMRQIPENLQVLKALPIDTRLLIHCHHGGRSMRVTQWLRGNGVANVSNVAGGIDAWAEKFDPAMRRY